MTATNRLIDYLKYRDWTSSTFLERQGIRFGMKDSRVSRTCRELSQPTKSRPAMLDRRLNEHGIVEYKHRNARVIEFTPEQLEIRESHTVFD